MNKRRSAAVHAYIGSITDNCALCGTLTNHTTVQHEQAEIRECTWCGEPLKDGDEFDGDPESTMHQTCAYEWRDDAYDRMSKDEGGQG